MVLGEHEPDRHADERYERWTRRTWTTGSMREHSTDDAGTSGQPRNGGRNERMVMAGVVLGLALVSLAACGGSGKKSTADARRCRQEAD